MRQYVSAVKAEPFGSKMEVIHTFQTLCVLATVRGKSAMRACANTVCAIKL